MASSLFGSRPTAPIMNNNMIGMLQQFNEFKNKLNGQDAKSIVQNMISRGELSQQQFEQFAAMANQLSNIFK